MNLQKLNPWNWFQHEENESISRNAVPVKRDLAEQNLHRSFEPVLNLHREIDRMFDEVFSHFGNTFSSPVAGNFFRPNADISGSENKYEVTLDVPGMKTSDIQIELHGNTLHVRGEKQENSETKDKQFYRVERSCGMFQRTLTLPEDADGNDIHADLSDGVLKISIPRKQTAEKDVRRISIN